jgi:DUF2924 family protein
MLQSDTAVKLEALTTASPQELKNHWEKLYRSTPPKGMSRKLVIRACAYRMQTKAYGGLRSSERRALVAHGSKDRSEVPVSDGGLQPGTRLVRDYQGISHVVDVVEDGFRWDNRTFTSLSAVARAITGTRWNGLVFFGLKKRGR